MGGMIMNLVANNCVGGCFYKDENLQYTNPFIWTAVHAPYFLKGIKNWDNIDWLNYEIYKDKDWNFFIKIDDTFILKCVHFIFSPHDSTIRKANGMIYYNKIWEYINDTYLKRIERMKESPIFIIDWEKCLDFTEENQNEFLNSYDFKYPIILITNLHSALQFKNDKLHVIIDEHVSSQSNGAAEIQTRNHKKNKRLR